MHFWSYIPDLAVKLSHKTQWATSTIWQYFWNTNRVLQFSIQTYCDFSFRMSKWSCWFWPSKGCLGEAELTILYEQQEESQSITLFCSPVWEPSDTCCQLKLQIDVSEGKKSGFKVQQWGPNSVLCYTIVNQEWLHWLCIASRH